MKNTVSRKIHRMADISEDVKDEDAQMVWACQEIEVRKNN